MKKFITLAVVAAFAAGSVMADDKRDNPEKKVERRDNPEAKEGRKRDGDKPGAVVDRELQREAKIFVAYDKDKSGTVSDVEMAAMREGKLDSRQKRQIRDEIKKADRNGDGVLDLDEWHVLMINRRAPGAREDEGRRGGEREKKRDQPEKR